MVITKLLTTYYGARNTDEEKCVRQNLLFSPLFNLLLVLAKTKKSLKSAEDKNRENGSWRAATSSLKLVYFIQLCVGVMSDEEMGEEVRYSAGSLLFYVACRRRRRT
jgi:hypothetical protein